MQFKLLQNASLACLILPVAGLPAAGNGPVYSLPPIEAVPLAPDPDHLATTDDMAREPDLSVLLTRLPGLFVDGAPGTGSPTDLTIRGGDPNMVVVDLEGILVNNIANSRGGAVDFTFTDARFIESVQAFHGTEAFFQGPFALSGAVRLQSIQQAGSPDRTTVDVQAGNRGFRSAAAVSHTSRDDTRQLSSGIAFVDAGEPVDGAGFEAQRAFAGWQHTGAEGSFKLYAFVADIADRYFPEESGGPELAVIRESDARDRKSAGTSLQHQSKDRSREVILSWFFEDTDAQSPGVAPGGRDPFGLPATLSSDTFNRARFRFMQAFPMTASWECSIGLESILEEGSNTSRFFLPTGPLPTNFDLQRFTHSLYLKNAFQLAPKWELKASGRLDLTEDHGTQALPALSLHYRPTAFPGQFQASYARNFKQPSFFALGNPLFGNPELEPEEGTLMELGWSVQAQTRPWQGGVQIFSHDFSNLIDFDPGPPPGLVNRARTRSQGMEIWLGWENGPFSAYLSATYLEAFDTGTGEDLRRLPDWMADLQLRWTPHARFEAELRLQHIGERVDTSIPTGERQLPSYTETQLSLRYHFPHISAVVTIGNLFNTDGLTRVGTPRPQRSLRCGLERSW